MPEPKYADILDHTLEVDETEASNLICKVDEARTNAAYWQGRCEATEKAITEIKAAHERAVDALREGFETTLSYLKDRLNRLEARP